MTTVIPYFDWPARAADWADDLVEVFQEVAESDEFILKSRVERLEAEIAARTGAAHAVAVASGTGALTVILAALGLGDGDEVVTPAFSFVSTASTVALRGARPVFADVEYETGLLDPAAAEAAVSARTRALLPAYLFSGSPKMGAFAEIAARHSLHLVEDSAIALGAEVDGKPAGRHGHAGVYSFFPAKPAGGIGDAGMIVTDDDDLARTARMLRNHGQPAGKRFYHELLGFNCRMDELTAGFLLRKLPHLDGLLEKRREIAAIYEEGLRPLAPALLPRRPGSRAAPSTPTWCAPSSARSCAPSWPARASRRPSTIRAPSTCSPRSRTSGTGPVTSPWPSSSPVRRSHCPCTRTWRRERPSRSWQPSAVSTQRGGERGVCAEPPGRHRGPAVRHRGRGRPRSRRPAGHPPRTGHGRDRVAYRRRPRTARAARR